MRELSYKEIKATLRITALLEKWIGFVLQNSYVLINVYCMTLWFSVYIRNIPCTPLSGLECGHSKLCFNACRTGIPIF